MAAACTTGTDPDPREVRRHLELSGALRSPTGDDPATPAMVAMMTEPAFAAPAMETAPHPERSALPEQRGVIVAVGRNAGQVADQALETAFAGACPELAAAFVACPDRDGVELMMTGRVDMSLLGGTLSSREMHAGLRQTRLGVEVYALAVAPDFPTHSLTRTQVRQVLTGEITDWQQLGYDRGPVVVVVPADRDLAERSSRSLILGDNFTQNGIRVASDRHVADQILQNRGAIGVVRVTGQMTAGMKLLQIDWVSPTAEAFSYGNYPYGLPLHLVTSGQPSGPALQFLQFAQSEDGRELLRRTLQMP